MANNEIKNENYDELMEALPFTKLYIGHRKGEYKNGGTFDYIEVAEVNRWGSGEVVRLSIPTDLDKIADTLRLGDVVKCYIMLDGLSSTAEKECIRIDKIADSNLPMPKTLAK